jgi:hypothetical protein
MAQPDKVMLGVLTITWQIIIPAVEVGQALLVQMVLLLLLVVEVLAYQILFLVLP